MNDLNLGWNEIPAAAQVSPFAAHNSALTHPVLLKTGVSKITVDSFNGLTIFSANGAKIKHAAFAIKRSSNVIIRNLEFDELWEWDEATKGNYDKNDWDYITLEEDNKVWIDHCTFNKAYDGLVDSKKGTSGVTVSWSTFKGDDGGSNSWVTQQINALEANKSAYPMYNFLRSGSIGLSPADIIAIAGAQKKGHLVGATEFDSTNANLSITLHHNYYKDIQDRMPRLRGGNAHVYNIVMDSAGAWGAKKRLTTAMESAIAAKGYHFGITSNGAISTEGGAVLVEKSQIIDVASPIRNNQADPSNAAYTGKIRAVDTMYSLDGSSFRGGGRHRRKPARPGTGAGDQLCLDRLQRPAVQLFGGRSFDAEGTPDGQQRIGRRQADVDEDQLAENQLLMEEEGAGEPAPCGCYVSDRLHGLQPSLGDQGMSRTGGMDAVRKPELRIPGLRRAGKSFIQRYEFRLEFLGQPLHNCDLGIQIRSPFRPPILHGDVAWRFAVLHRRSTNGLIRISRAADA
ncbi:hypothetical protein LJK87_35420 [Paenibacillus sp. P25]|nr:hypothetical protein LJK87_35420 [Paenibacillus sp. P25]